MINYKLSEQLHFNYSNAYPFPHIVIDNFLDKGIAQRVYHEMKNFNGWDWDPTDYSEGVQKNKFFCPGFDFQIEFIKNDAPITYSVLDFLNSDIMLSYLQQLTGIENLIPDDKFVGGGMHKITKDGKLAVHADYNIHPVTKLHRRLNLLIYLNPNWQEEWGGHLELWNQDLSQRTHNILPIFNRAVIFNITDDAYHGHPHPLNCPEDEARFSLAMYYFTDSRPTEEINEEHAALWVFPEEAQKTDDNLEDLFKINE